MPKQRHSVASSRRNFLKGAGVGAAASVVAPVPSNAIPAMPQQRLKAATVLSDKDIADIYAFLEALPGPRSPNEVSILNN